MNNDLVLMLAYWFPPDNSSGARRPGCFAKYLGDFGYRSEVVAACSAPDSTVTLAPPLEPHRQESIACAILGGVQRFLVPHNDRLPWIPFAVGAGRRILTERSGSIIFSTSPPVATHLAALVLKRRFGLPWVADFRDPIRDNPWRTRDWVYPYDTWIESLVFKNADMLIANTDTVARIWTTRYPALRHKVRVLPNGFDPASEVKALPLPNRSYRVLAHVGSLYGGRDPHLLLESLLRLLESGNTELPRVVVRLVGEVGDHIKVRNRETLEALTAQNAVQFDGVRLPKEDADRIAAESDYLLLLDINSADKDLQVPAKLYDYVQIGRPILAFTKRGSPTDKILRVSGIPHECVYTDDSSDATDKKLGSFLRLPPEPSATDPRFDEAFNCRNQVGQLAGWFDELLS